MCTPAPLIHIINAVIMRLRPGTMAISMARFFFSPASLSSAPSTIVSIFAVSVAPGFTRL